MQRMFCRRSATSALLAALLVSTACNRNKDTTPTNSVPPNAGGPNAGGPWAGKKGSPLGQAMNKIGKGPQSLHSQVGRELKADAVTWDKLLPQAKEYAELAESMKTFDKPNKGDKNSWTEQTTGFAKSAEDLNKAAIAQDKNAALAAHLSLSNSCKSCHDAHRGGPGGRGRPGGPPPGPPQG